jgi:hypothetical protein
MNDPHGVSCEDFFLNQVLVYGGYCLTCQVRFNSLHYLPAPCT